MGVQQQPAIVNKPKTTKPMSEARKIRKPLMERKRRERINTCLNDLAALLIDAKMVKTEAGKQTKLEKADILELTVKHIKSFKAQDDTSPQLKAEEDKRTSSYKDGFTKCMGMVDQTLGKAGKEALRQRLLSHLKNCLKTLDPSAKEPSTGLINSSSATSEGKSESEASESDASAASSDSETEKEEEDKKIESRIPETNTKESTPRITLVPTRLPSGGVAFVIQGGIDPSLLLPQKDDNEKNVDRKGASPPPSPATCDSSTSSATPISRPDCVPTPSTSSATPPTPPHAFTTVTTTYTPTPQLSADSYAFTSSSSDSQSTAAKPVPTQYPVSHTYTSPCVPNAVYPEFHCPSTTPYSTFRTATPPGYCPPESSHQEDPSSTNSHHVPSTSSYHTLTVPSQPHPIPHHPSFSHHSHDLPTPPPSISPQNILPVQQYHHYQQVSSEEDMDTDGLSEEEVDIDVENDVPYDLSMRRIWRFW